jgi:hypothetical protein
MSARQASLALAASVAGASTVMLAAWWVQQLLRRAADAEAALESLQVRLEAIQH